MSSSKPRTQAPIDAAEIHYRLARQLWQNGDRQMARREVLKALEEAPRFRDAHRLLLTVVGELEKDADKRDTPETRKRKF